MDASKIREMKGPLLTSNGGRTNYRENIEEGSELWFLREIAAQLAELNQNVKDAAKQVDDRSLFGQVFGK